MRFSSASRLQGSAGLLIKQKSAAQGNIEEASGRLADVTNRDNAFRNRPDAPVSEVRYIAAASDTNFESMRALANP
jgi:hypothetical protein